MEIEFFDKASFSASISNDCPRISINFDSGTFNINKVASKMLTMGNGEMGLVFGFELNTKAAFIALKSGVNSFNPKSVTGPKGAFKCSFRSKPLSELFKKHFLNDIFKNRLQIIVDYQDPITELFPLLTLPASTQKANN